MQEKVEETKNYKRTRLESPKSCKPNTFRTKEVNKKGDKIVVCQDKKSGKWKAQSKMEKKNESLFSTINKLNRLVESINENVEDKLQKIANEVKAEINKIYKDDKDLLEYFYVEPKVKKEHYDDGSDMYYIEVRTELGYNALWDLAEKLDKVVQKYDRYAYFDMEGGGTISAVITFDVNESLNEEHEQYILYAIDDDTFEGTELDSFDNEEEAIEACKRRQKFPYRAGLSRNADLCVMRHDFTTDEYFPVFGYMDGEEKYFNESLNEEDDKFNYMMLGRLKQDCDYFLGHGNGYEKHLWAGNVEDQIAKMKELYNKVPEKPEWLSSEDIDKYEKDMLAKRDSKDESLNEVKEFARDKWNDVKEITRDKWNKTPKDYKMIKNGKPYLVYLDNETHSTVLGPCKILDESLNETDNGLRNDATNGRLESDKEKENLKFLKQKQQKQQKENKMSKLGKLTEELNTIINEISDETVENAYDARRKNFDAANGQEDEKFQNYVRARKRFKNADVIEDEEEFDQALEDRKQSGKEWKNSVEELDNAQKKFKNNVDLMLRRKFRQAKQAAQTTQKDEAFHDGMLTDINDLDFPDALADTVETTEEGEVLTLGKVAADVRSLKDEIMTELKTIKADLKDDIQDVKNDIKDTVENSVEDTIDDNFEEIEFLDDMDNEVEEIQDEIENAAEEDDNEEDDNEEDDNEEDDNEEENKDNEELEDKPEEELEESYKKYIKTGKLEDLQKTKQAIDKAVQQGEDVEKVKAEIELNAEDEKEEEAAKEYAADKLTEALYATQKTCKIKL